MDPPISDPGRKLLYKYPDDIRGRQFTTSEEFSKNMKNNAIFPGVLAGSSFALGLLTTINPYLATASTGTILGVSSYLDKKKSKEEKNKSKKKDDTDDSKEESPGDDGSSYDADLIAQNRSSTATQMDEKLASGDIDPDEIETQMTLEEARKEGMRVVTDKFKEFLEKKNV